MSTLETEVGPYLGTMLHGVSVTLTGKQQQTIASWLVKIAMVLEATSLRGRSYFYRPEDREQLRLTSAIPLGSLIWLGKFAGTGLHVDGVDVWFTVGKDTRAANGCVTNFVVGQLVAQVMSVRFARDYDKKPIRIHGVNGPWNQALIGIWPTTTVSVDWPPSLHFTLNGLPTINALRSRWRHGGPQMVSSRSAGSRIS